MSSLLNSHCLVCNEDITCSESFIVTTVLDPNSLLQHTFFNVLESFSSFMLVDITKVSQHVCEKCHEAGLQARQFQSLCNRTADALMDASRENLKQEYRCTQDFNSDSSSDESDHNADPDYEIPMEMEETVITEPMQSTGIKKESTQSHQITGNEGTEEEQPNVFVKTQIDEDEEEGEERNLNEDNASTTDLDCDEYFNHETRKLLGPSPLDVWRQRIRDGNNRRGRQKVKCKECLKTFSRSYMVIHMRSHTGERPYKCKLCPKAFKDASTFKSHQLTHSGERPFLCTLCGQGFRTKTMLNYHATIHNGEKNYSCEVCGKEFRVARQLAIHVTVHSDAKNFACDQCPKTFRNRHLLKQHMVTHAAIKPVECTFCGRRFSQRHVLRSHQAKSCPGLKTTNE